MGTAPTTLTARIAADFERAAAARPAAAPDLARRQAALETLRARGLPGPRDENWRYANLRALENQGFAPAPAGAPPAPERLPPELPGCARYLYADGEPVAERSAAPTATAAAIAPIDGGAATPSPAARDDERFALVNAAFARGGVAVHVPAGAAARIELVWAAQAPATSGTLYPRIEVDLAADAELFLVERHVGTEAEPVSVNSAVTVALARGARLEHYRLQDLNGRSTFIDTLSGTLAAGAEYRLRAVASGAQSSRSTLAVTLAGERAAFTCAVAALGERTQVQDFCVVAEHAAAATRSEQTFRGIAAGRARVACNGKVVVAPGALGSDSRQSLRGLLAGAEAEIDVRPQLEIHTDDVRCSHGATAGKLDPDMLFYLLSRGLDPEVAQRLLKWAFLEDVVAQFAHPALRRQIEGRLAGALADDVLRELL